MTEDLLESVPPMEKDEDNETVMYLQFLLQLWNDIQQQCWGRLVEFGNELMNCLKVFQFLVRQLSISCGRNDIGKILIN